jgi:hypothetical protein
VQVAALSALSVFESLFPNRAQRSVNRKVQGSNPWSGAKSELSFDTRLRLGRLYYSNQYSNGARESVPD